MRSTAVLQRLPLNGMLESLKTNLLVLFCAAVPDITTSDLSGPTPPRVEADTDRKWSSLSLRAEAVVRIFLTAPPVVMTLSSAV